MTRLNATVTGGYVNRAGEIVLNVKPDRGDPVQVKHWEALPDGKRVVLVGRVIEGVQ
jgi:hypothetical protein